MTSKKGDTPRKSNSVKFQQGADLKGVGLGKEVLGHTATRVCSPGQGPFRVDAARDRSTGGGGATVTLVR